MTTRHITKKFFEPAFDLWKITSKAVFFSVIRTCYNLLSVLLIQKIIQYLQSWNLEAIQSWLIVYVVIFVLVMILFTNIYSRWRGNQIYAYDNYIQKKYLNVIMLIENTAFEKVGTGRFISIIKSASEGWSDMLTSLSFELPAFFISIVYSMLLAYQLSPWFLLCYVGIFVLLFLYIVRINKKSLLNRRNMADTKVWLSRHIVKMLMSKLEIIISGKLKNEIAKTEEFNRELTRNNIRLSFYTFFTHEWPRSFLNVTKVILIALLAYGMIAGGLPLPQVIWFLVVLWYVDTSLQDFAKSYKNTTKRLPDIQKLWEFEHYPSIGNSYNSGKKFVYKKWHIHFENLSFGYGASAQIFTDCNLAIQGQKKTALVWPSWWGKSTLIKLIAWYLSPDEGDVMIDNQKLSETSLISYYQHIWYLTQEPSVFDGTVRENLLYAIDYVSGTPNSELPTPNLDDIIKASKCEWIYELPDGLDTEIGEKGIRLSWGQKQRLAIAKIMLKNPDIILLDEPTSALDSYNEEQVTQALNNLFKNKTVIVIAHRLQTVKHADDIIYISDGKVIERGTHEELLALQWEYYRMVELQSGF